MSYVRACVRAYVRVNVRVNVRVIASFCRLKHTCSVIFLQEHVKNSTLVLFHFFFFHLRETFPVRWRARAVALLLARSEIGDAAWHRQ